ncbi:MAG: helix-turn-helix transcriptional regulator [Dehalococcoidia bacterium]|nr:helix-turn-helix transcriptional regulator [Dehalococcoidia bacterium]
MSNRIQELRKVKGWTQFELCRRSNTPQGLLSMLERGKLQPWPKVTKRLCKALGVRPEELFPEGEPCEVKR